ncbi:concanavalin A-like lectin/glucanase superfamily protein [Arcicella aurantiaca]|uniref:Concanavalin A-like lectin/glucanase superfamily protein n=1 Tax=Arcicella aurantiaca TaxID=591202 RepID=A0A316DWC9_9BACT|nr:LamG-like jellyroll fold domain-containing protein [Arcicella aurantiaca]PWK22354.1 concanavalin A-like lectin/glucanase superfamily protein [Arcicella aurantiaca]
MQKKILYLLLGWLMLFGGQRIFAQTDTLCNPNEKTKIFGELYFNYGSATNSYTSFNRSTFSVGQSLVSSENMQSTIYQLGFGAYSPWFLPPQPPVLIATQGEFKDRVKISWNVNPLSPSPSGFVIYRDGSFIADLGENVRDYLDFNVQAGEYYEYSIEAKNVYGTGSRSKSVGFVNPNGVVSGKIETNSGNPVPGVEVRLTPLTGNSMAFDGVNDELCVSYNSEFPTDKFTVSAYVKLGDTNNEGAIIDWGSSLNKNWWITTTKSGEAKGYIFHIGNGTGSDSLKYYLPDTPANPFNVGNWHQITMVYNGSAMSVMVDGEFIGTKPASISRASNYLNIGSKIGDGGFFKGKIDDIRVYNRPLTQTEVNNTKHRSVSKSENGLVSYWKMDEGVGAKVFDNTTIPTNANIYGATFSADKPEVYSSGVSDVTGYYTIDGINYSQTESFRATPMKNFEFNTALEFNAADKSYGNLTDYDVPDTSTVEILFHPFDLKSRQTILSKGNLYEAYIDNGKLFLKLNGTITDLGAIKAKFYHLAVTIDNHAGSANVYLEGELKGTVSFSGTSNWKNGTPWLLATNSTDANTGKFYTGLVDEFYIYKTALPQYAIQEHFVLGVPQDSTTKNLFTHFDLNEGSDTKVYDYAIVNFGATTPREGTILKASWSNNSRRAETKPHEFEPNVRVVNLNTSNTAIGNIDFKDVSTVNVSGYVRFANTFCFADSIDILVNGQPFFPSIRTDKNGKWSVDFEPGKTVKLSASYKDHLFSPSFFELRKLQAPKAGIVFLDNTKRTIRGQVAGNDKCRKSVIPAGARVVVKVATLDGCFEKTDTLRNPDGKFIFRDLPARAFRVSVVEHSNSVIYNYFQLKGGQEVDLRDAVSDTTDFIYIAPPQIEMAGITPNECNLKIANQFLESKFKIKVFEQYDGGKCYVDGATLSIDNPSVTDKVDTTLAENVQEFEYKFKPQKVNIIQPYQTLVTVKATVGSATTTDTTSFVVLGNQSTAGTFTTSSPQLPQFVLRDPPGDGSYATLEKGFTHCTSNTRSVINDLGEEFSVGHSIGGETHVGIPGNEISVKNEVKIVVSGGSNQTWNYSTNESTCITTNKVISTSASDGVVGSEDGGDVYFGFAENITYGGNIEVNFKPDSCKFYTKKNLQIDSKTLGGDFVYSERHIIKDVIPALKLLASQPKDINPYRARDSSAYILWEKYILLNKIDKGILYEKTISFDAGAVYEESTTTENTNGWTETFDAKGWYGGNAEFVLKALGGIEGNVAIKHEHTKSNTHDDQTTNVYGISYHFEDDDVGDNFLVKVFRGLIWDSYNFELIAGESSCPWEKGTRQRSAPSLVSLDGNSKVNVPANTSAVYQLQLGNASPTDEAMNYDLSLDPATNPDGAIVKVNGQPLTQPITFRIDPGQSQIVTLTLDKGPLKYDYSDITIQLESACETELADARGGDTLVDEYFVKTINLAASFIEPCSPVDIGFPLQGFVVTPAFQNRLSVTLNEYNKNDADLKLIRLQYRPIGGDGSWININETPKADLGDVFTIKEWGTSLLKDGPYEIRAVAECFNPNLAPGISTVVKGSIEREPPVVFGVPEPGDGTWDPGDEISITFNESIDCDKVVQADILANNTIGLYDATTNALVDATITCVGTKIIITPNINPVFFENRTFRVVVSGKDYDDAMTAQNPNHQAAAIRDKAGNMIPKTIKWEFAVNQNNLEWVGTDVIETNEVLKPFTVKRQIRNRGGSITSFRMESVPSWLTVTPSTGTLNPGQVADVTLTFQQDLLIGDYLDTVQMHGSKGDEPLLIDYRVRCPQPAYVVDNPSQYEGSMNMVVDLSIFGVKSKDPSDVIIAKIDGKIRGVGRVQYYRNIPTEGTNPITGQPDDSRRWLTFLTIYGNSTDIDKPIEFHVWDGDKCNEYVEVLEQITYEEGGLVGSPLEPQPIHVLNLVKKSIALNKGFNWVSFNLNLGAGNNTFTKVLASLKHKTGAMIKTDDNFANYENGAWDALDDVVLPTKRYLIYVPEQDTINIKGEPYTSTAFPITIKAKPQWNWLGYVPSTGMTVTQALRGLTPLNGDIIKSQTLFAQYVAGVGWIGNLSFLEPLKGYLLKISNTGQLTYNTNIYGLEGSGEKEVSSKDLQNQASLEAPMIDDFTKYQSNMNLIGKVNGMTIDADDELRAYINGTLVSRNKSISHGKSRLFFNTIYFEDEQTVSFKLFKADRNKEYDLDKNVQFQADALSGLVEDPIVFELTNNVNPAVTIVIEDQIIKQPDKVFGTVSIPASITESSPNCGLYAVSTILPTGNETKPTCSAQTLEGSMTSVIKVYFNELSSFVSDQDVLSFVNPATGATVGCGVFRANNSLFYTTISGTVTSAAVPLDVIYYSNSMKKSFTLKGGLSYKYNTNLGTGANPHKLDFSPLAVSVDNSGIITTVLRDTSWIGSYGVKAIAMNCTGYNDGEKTFYFRRIAQNDCSYSFSVPTTNTPVCKGGTITLGANKGANYAWSGPNGFTSTERNPKIVSASSAAGGIYTLTVTSYRCQITATTNVVVKALNMSVSSNAPLCEKTTLSLSSSGGTTYAWRGPNGFTSNIPNPEIPNISTAGSGTYTVVMENNGCKDSTTTNVLVKLLPVIEMEASSVICEAGTLQLGSNGGSSYLWSGPNSFSSTLQNPQIPNVSSNNAGTYTVTVSLNLCSSTASTSVIVTPLPAIPTISGINEICASTPTVLKASAIPNATYTWSNNATGTSITVEPTVSQSYTVTATVNGCSRTSAAFAMTVNPLYTSPTITASSLQICKGESVILSASCPASTDVFRWETPVANSSVLATNTNNRIVTEPGTYIGFCEPTVGCASAKVSVTITQSANCNGQNFITITPNKPIICPNSTVILSATGCTGTVTWFGGASTQTGTTATFNPTATTTYLAQCSTGGSTSVDVVVAPTSVNVVSDIVTGLEKVKATGAIESDKRIGDGIFTPSPNVTYEAGQTILLKPGFDTAKNAVFKAEIRTCN